LQPTALGTILERAAAEAWPLACSATSALIAHRSDVRTEHGVDPGLVPRTLGLEPSEDVAIDP